MVNQPPPDAVERAARIIDPWAFAYTTGREDARRKARAKAAEILSAPPAPNVWQPIETAPKDGTNVLTFTPSGGGWAADIDTAYWYPQAGAWVLFQHEIGICPTHWMPIPAAPTVPTAGKTGDAS